MICGSGLIIVINFTKFYQIVEGFCLITWQRILRVITHKNLLVKNCTISTYERPMCSFSHWTIIIIYWPTYMKNLKIKRVKGASIYHTRFFCCSFDDSTYIHSRECKIIENVTLVLALKFEDFQGKSSKHPWNFNSLNPWIDLDFPWKPNPRPHLEFRGFSRVNFEKPWAQNIALILALNFKDFWGFSR